MTDLVSFIVGIERYDQPDWNQCGPARNAIAVADLLLNIGTPAAAIHLFLDPLPDPQLEADMARLAGEGVRLTRAADWDTIDRFVRTGLAAGCSHGSRLLVYWSGHGFSTDGGRRVFCCSDYTADLLCNRALDGSGLRHALHRGLAYQCFAEQVFLADVCANHGSELQLRFTGTEFPAGEPAVANPRQVAWFVREGHHARGNHGLGIFTKIALGVLARCPGWPAPEELWGRMDEAFVRADCPVFRVDCFRDAGEKLDLWVGTPSVAAGSALFDTLYPLLSTFELPDPVYRPHYRRTVRRLRDPRLEEAQGLREMIRALSSLCDAKVTGQVPDGLIEFLVRLCEEPPLAAPIADWLTKHAADQGHDQANARERIADERAHRILIVALKHDPQREDITGYTWFLRDRNLMPVADLPPAPPPRYAAVAGWSDFARRFPSLLADLDPMRRIKEIHFAVDPPLFDRPFHRIPIGDDQWLGENYVVLVRYLDRLTGHCGPVRDCWCAHGEALRQAALRGAVPVLPIPASGSAPAVAPGFCYTRFTVPPGPRGAEKLTLMRWLRAGFAYLSWSHEVPPDEGWDRLADCYADWLKPPVNLDAFPMAFTKGRLRQQAAAQHATLLWDDPDPPLFLTLKGIEER